MSGPREETLPPSPQGHRWPVASEGAAVRGGRPCLWRAALPRDAPSCVLPALTGSHARSLRAVEPGREGRLGTPCGRGLRGVLSKRCVGALEVVRRGANRL